MEREDFYTYILLDTRKPGRFNYEGLDCSFLYEPFYVGKGCKKRVTRHFKEFYGRATWRENIVKKIQRETGFDPGYIIYLSNSIESIALLTEIKVIKLIGRKDKKLGPLCNLTDGGETVSDSPEIKAKRIEKTKKFYQEHPEMKDRISKQNLERWSNPEYKEKLRKTHKENHKNNPDRKIAVGKKVSQFYIDNPDKRQEKCDASRGFNNSNCKISKNKLIAILKLLSSVGCRCMLKKL